MVFSVFVFSPYFPWWFFLSLPSFSLRGVLLLVAIIPRGHDSDDILVELLVLILSWSLFAFVFCPSVFS